jgi:hypothetical protein
LDLAVGLWSLRNKCNHEFANLTDSSKMGFSSRCIYFPNIIKAGAKFPCRGAAFEPSPAFMVFEK